MDKKYTYTDSEEGMVHEGIAVAYNQPAVHMEVVHKIHNSKQYELEQLDPELQEMIREQEEARNDPAWAEWSKGLTPEQWSKLGDYYDSMDEDDPTQWYTQEEMDARIHQLINDYAHRI